MRALLHTHTPQLRLTPCSSTKARTTYTMTVLKPLSWRAHASSWLHFLLRTRLAPYHPIPSVNDTLRLLQLTPSDTLVDLGCGDGNMLIQAIQKYDIKQAIGYEMNKEISRQARQNLLQQQIPATRAQIHHADARTADLSSATAIVMYLSEHGNRALLPILVPKLKLEPQTRVVSYLFPIPTLNPVKTIQASAGSGIFIRLYDGRSLPAK